MIAQVVTFQMSPTQRHGSDATATPDENEQLRPQDTTTCHLVDGGCHGTNFLKREKN